MGNVNVFNCIVHVVVGVRYLVVTTMMFHSPTTNQEVGTRLFVIALLAIAGTALFKVAVSFSAWSNPSGSFSYVTPITARRIAVSRAGTATVPQSKTKLGTFSVDVPYTTPTNQWIAPTVMQQAASNNVCLLVLGVHVKEEDPVN